ncbi:response regulator [bacterium]|nr:response regulator [bacterium]
MPELPDNSPLPRKVLIVDDYPLNRKLLRATLEAEGVEVSEAADGLEAICVLEQQAVEAIISDILMPNMDGYRLCHELRSSEKFRAMPLIMYTNTYTSPGDREMAFTVGADEYITKPASTADICAALRRARVKAAERDGSQPSELGEEFVLKKYANVLIRKLERKNNELEIARKELEKINRELDERVKQRTSQLDAANKELDSFCHAVSHDLRAPLRTISGFTELLTEKCQQHLDSEAKHFLGRIGEATNRMGELIDDLLGLSRVSREELQLNPTNLTALAERVIEHLREREPERKVDVQIAPDLKVQGDSRLLLIVLENLLGNAWKFSSKTPAPRIEAGVERDDAGNQVFFVKDNGAGFDMKYAEKLFTAFQRMHTQDDFPGTGVGLATVQRIIHRHGGDIWAESKAGEGATFRFTLKPAVRKVICED